MPYGVIGNIWILILNLKKNNCPFVAISVVSSAKTAKSLAAFTFPTISFKIIDH
jgi:hypothetical protein